MNHVFGHPYLCPIFHTNFYAMKMKQLLFLFATILLCSSCKKDPPSPINESQYLRINGTDQFVMLRGDDIKNPVLLFLHGGPGASEIAHMSKYNRDLEKDFTVVYWDQRNACKSYVPDFSPDEIRVDKYVADVDVLAKYLKNKFQKDKLFLVGYSWGSRLGMYTIQKHPEHFSAYVGVGQEVAAYEAEKLSYEFTLQQAQALNKPEIVAQLEALGAPKNGDYRTMYPNGLEGFWIQKGLLGEMHPEIYNGFTPDDFFGVIHESPEYSPVEKENYIKGIEASNAYIMDDEKYHNFDFRTQFPTAKIPVFFISGKYDYVVPMPLSKAYSELIQAPKKEFILFENSGHHPSSEEAERFNKEIVRIYNEI
jgi:proline iminopeptidase